MENGAVQAAARIGEMFHIDPLATLDSDNLSWIIRMACARVIAKDRADEAARLKAQR